MLSLSFRCLMGVLLPMIIVAISTVWTLGIMSLLQIPLSILGTVIPVLMLAAGSAYGIHLISRYFDEASPNKNQRGIVFRTSGHVDQPVALAGLATIIGFGSLGISKIVPMRSFAIFTALGVLIALVIALLFLPSMLLLCRRPLPQKESTHIRISDRFIREKFVGTKSFNIIISGEIPGDSPPVIWKRAEPNRRTVYERVLDLSLPYGSNSWVNTSC